MNRKSRKKIFIRNELRVIFSGRRDNLRDDVRDGIEKLEEVTNNYNEVKKENE